MKKGQNNTRHIRDNILKLFFVPYLHLESPKETKKNHVYLLVLRLRVKQKKGYALKLVDPKLQLTDHA